MLSSPRHRKLVAIATAAVAVVAVLGGTSYAASRPSHSARAPHASQPLSKHDVKSLIKTYVTKHASTKPTTFAVSTNSTAGGGPAGTFGPWTLNMTCTAKGVSVSVTGPGITAGTNTLGATNGGAGSSFETFGTTGGSNGIGQGAQGSQTLMLIDTNIAYTVTYIANADNSSPTNCDLLGYALPIS
jgi:hypothetical protein